MTSSNRELLYSKKAEKFILHLNRSQSKHARQILIKLAALPGNPLPPDSIALKGIERVYRLSVGEYRVIYVFDDTSVTIALIGKRNDSEIYKQFNRKLN